MAGRADLLIIGVDPATAIGKPRAMAAVSFKCADDRELRMWMPNRVKERLIHDRIEAWRAEFVSFLFTIEQVFFGLPDMVAIEDARPRGRGGANMQHLVSVLKEAAKELGIRVELIPPGTVKKCATGRGNAEAAEVAVIVRAEYKGAESIPIVVGEYDVEAAVAIAGAGYALLQEEWLKEGENNGMVY